MKLDCGTLAFRSDPSSHVHVLYSSNRSLLLPFAAHTAHGLPRPHKRPAIIHVGIGAVQHARGAPNPLCHLPAVHGPVDPICLLFLDEPGSPLLGVTEWQQGSAAPQFLTVLTLAVSPSLQLDSPLRPAGAAGGQPVLG